MYYFAVNEDGLHAFPTAAYRNGFCRLGQWNSKECNLDKRYNNVYYWSSNMCSVAIPTCEVDLAWFYSVDGARFISITQQALNEYHPDVEDDVQVTSAEVHKWLTAREKEWMDTCADSVSFKQYLIKYNGWDVKLTDPDNPDSPRWEDMI